MKTIQLTLVYDPAFVTLEDEEVITMTIGDVVADRFERPHSRVGGPLTRPLACA